MTSSIFDIFNTRQRAFQPFLLQATENVGNLIKLFQLKSKVGTFP